MEEALAPATSWLRIPFAHCAGSRSAPSRRNMLANSFSFLPAATDIASPSRWKLVSDFSIAMYLRAAKSRSERSRRLARQLGEALDAGDVTLIDAPTCEPEDSIATVLERSKGLPVLVVGSNSDLRGIITPFDVL